MSLAVHEKIFSYMTLFPLSTIYRAQERSFGTFTKPDARFDHVHIDVVGPSVPSRGYTHLLTSIDRLTRRPEATPVAIVMTESVA